MAYTQDKSPLVLTTPLGKDMLLIIGVGGQEAISHLFNFKIEALAENKNDVSFEKLLGQKITASLELPGGDKRYYNGIVTNAIERGRSQVFTEYTLEIVPQLWLLTRRTRSRIFQHINVPDILKQLFADLNVSYQLQGTYQPRNYCVQYRETDFNFASRLMEEEGIFYFFKHTDGDHQMIVGDNPEVHPEVPSKPTAIYEAVTGGARDEDRVHAWTKTQSLRSGKCTLWDHHFQLPHKHLEASKTILDTVSAGTVSHKLDVANNAKMELYDYPGAYAQRFDGVDSGGGEQPEELQKIFQDNQRTVDILAEREAVQSLRIQGASGCRQFTSGHKFSLQRHFNADGDYVLVSVQHACQTDNYRSQGKDFSYSNIFTCIPSSLPFRPTCAEKPRVYGTQTAVVVGPGGEEIYTEQFGRVKIQFHWDQQGVDDSNSSCWARVATFWAGKQWGAVHIPRIGQEVVIGFEEGDPDHPIIIGSVYNPDQMPPYDLPANKTQSGIKSRSSPGGGAANFNEIRFEDKMGSEMLTIHAEKDEEIIVEHDKTENVGHDETIDIGNDRTEEVGHDQTITVLNDDSLTVAMDQTIMIGVDQNENVGAERTTIVGMADSLTVGAARTTEIGADDSLNVGAAISITSGAAITITAGAAITISSAAAIAITSAAAIAITAPVLTLNGRPVLPVPAPI